MTDKPTLTEALRSRYAASRAQRPDSTPPQSIDLTADVRALAERVDAHPELAAVLTPIQRHELDRYRAYRATREGNQGDE